MEADLLEIQRALWPKVKAADVWAVQRALDCMDRLARLRGLDAPIRKSVEIITQSQVDAEIAKLEEEMASRHRA
jgi:hypothetical protein